MIIMILVVLLIHTLSMVLFSYILCSIPLANYFQLHLSFLRTTFFEIVFDHYFKVEISNIYNIYNFNCFFSTFKFILCFVMFVFEFIYFIFNLSIQHVKSSNSQILQISNIIQLTGSFRHPTIPCPAVPTLAP